MRLRDFLREAALSQNAFARLSGIAQPQVSMYVTGRRRPSIETAIAIERATRGMVPVHSWADLPGGSRRRRAGWHERSVRRARRGSGGNRRR